MKQYYYSFSIIMCVCVVHSSIVKMLRIWLVCNKLFEFVWHHDFFFIFFFFCYVRHFKNIFFWCLNFFFKLITWLYIFKRVKVFDRVDQIPANYLVSTCNFASVCVRCMVPREDFSETKHLPKLFALNVSFLVFYNNSLKQKVLFQ